MKKILRVLLIILAAFFYLFLFMAAIGMICSGDLNLKSFISGSRIFIWLIGLCIVGFCALGEKPKKK